MKIAIGYTMKWAKYHNPEWAPNVMLSMEPSPARDGKTAESKTTTEASMPIWNM
jgi:hypothetical protein